MLTNNKIIQSIDSTEIYAYTTRKDLVCKEEEVIKTIIKKCKNNNYYHYYYCYYYYYHYYYYCYYSSNEVTEGNIKQHDTNWSQNSNHPYRYW